MPADPDRSSTALPRLSLNELGPALVAALGPRVERLGYLGEFYQCSAHQPEALLAFHAFSEVSKSALGEPLTELVALTSSVEIGNDYERNQHERLSIRQGHSREWVAAVERLDPYGSCLLDGHEREAQSLVLAVLRNHDHGARALVEAYAARYGAPAAIALLLVVGRYVAHAAVVKALEILPPVPSIFEDGFDGS